MNYGIYRKIKNEYEKRRNKAFDELEARKASLYFLIPRLKDIGDEIARAGFKYNKAILTGSMPPDNAARELSETIMRLKAEKTALLDKHGYPPEYLEPAFQCGKCSDTGIVKSEKTDSDTFCACFRQQLINLLYEQSNLGIANNRGFESFDTAYYSDMPDEERYGTKKSPRRLIVEILDNCKNFVENFEKNGTRNMLFSGPTGVGKTFMAGCVAIELMKRGHTVLYQAAPALFNTIYEYRYKKADNDEWESALYDNIFESDLLIIDDLGTEPPTGTRYSELLNIMDTRLAADSKRPCKTIICTNIDLKKLFNYYDERIISRIAGGFDIFKFAGDDIRRIKSLSPS